jgi:hypothetical protein
MFLTGGSKRMAVRSVILCVGGCLCLILKAQGPPGQARPSAGPQISERQVWFHLRGHLKTLGDRLSVVGKERLTLDGVLTRGAGTGATANSIRVISEISGKVRIEQVGPQGNHVTGFDGNAHWSDRGTPSSDDADLVETLFNDSAEHFFKGQTQGSPTRFYGTHFRLDDGKDPKYSGPYYDIYEVGDLAAQGGQLIRRPRIYCLNSQTLLLERAQYRIQRQGVTVKVETLLQGWQNFQGQQVPKAIVRTENGQQVWTFSVQSASTGPSLPDTLFSKP